jgi:hypothetical protein
MKDEQIYNALTKQVESMIQMAELAPNITDKEADFSIWSRQLSDIKQERVVARFKNESPNYLQAQTRT